MKRFKVKQAFSHLLNKSVKTTHSRFVAAGLLVGLVYLPLWLYDIWQGTLIGGGSLLMVAAALLGIHLLWVKRRQLAEIEVLPDDRWLGHFIIAGGIGLALFFSFAEWSQRLVFMVILVGVAISSWGISFFA